MRAFSVRSASSALLLVALASGACGGGNDADGTTTSGASSHEGSSAGSAGAGGTGGAGAGGDAGGAGAPALPAAICHDASAWAPGKQAFVEATAKWGLDTLAVQGVRLATVDVDGDGRPDLVVRRGGNGADAFAAGGVRQTWLLLNKGGSFADVTEASGLRKTRAGADPAVGRPGEVFAFGDVDNDGDLDVFTGLTADPKNPGAETSEVLLGDGKGNFALGPADSAVRQPPGKDAPAGASFVDFDRDGNLDLWVTENTVNGYPQQDRLYRGDGKGGFVDVTADMGLSTKPWSGSTTDADLNDALGNSIAWGAAACDLNGDGSPELLAPSYGRAPNHLWQGTGKAGGFQYQNRSIASGYAFDQNADWRDNESARCWCKLHPTDDECAGVPAPKYIACTVDKDAFRWNHNSDRNAYRLGGNSGTTSCADLDNDGDLDLVTSEIYHWDVGGSSDRAEALFNDGKADVTFARPGNAATGLARTYASVGFDEGIMTNSVFDFDNDGRADIYLGGSDYPENRGLLFHQVSAGKWEPVPLADGIDHHRSHGSVVADFDGDGDLDIVVGHSLARCKIDPKDPAECYATAQVRFFENVVGAGAGNFVKLSLVGGAGSNRAAIGARITVVAGGLTQTREIEGGHGHYGAQDELTAHFGLGAACEADVTVRWPDQALTTQTFKLPAGHRFVIEQGKPPRAAAK